MIMFCVNCVSNKCVDSKGSLVWSLGVLTGIMDIEGLALSQSFSTY